MKLKQNSKQDKADELISQVLKEVDEFLKTNPDQKKHMKSFDDLKSLYGCNAVLSDHDDCSMTRFLE